MRSVNSTLFGRTPQILFFGSEYKIYLRWLNRNKHDTYCLPSLFHCSNFATFFSALLLDFLANFERCFFLFFSFSFSFGCCFSPYKGTIRQAISIQGCLLDLVPNLSGCRIHRGYHLSENTCSTSWVLQILLEPIVKLLHKFLKITIGNRYRIDG